MNTTGGIDQETFTSTAIIIGAVIGLLVSVLVGSICAHFAARAVAAVPVEKRKIQPKAIWGIVVLSWAFLLGSVATTVFLVNNADAATPAVWINFAIQIIVTLLNLVWVWWVGSGVPASFIAAFESYPDEPDAPSNDRGRTLGRWMIAIYTISAILGLVVIGLSAGENPVEAARRGMDAGRQDVAVEKTADAEDAAATSEADAGGATASAKSPDEISQEQLEDMMSQLPTLVVSCGAGLFSFVYMILLIVFLVSITKSRGELLDLQYLEANPYEGSEGGGTPPLAD